MKEDSFLKWFLKKNAYCVFQPIFVLEGGILKIGGAEVLTRFKSKSVHVERFFEKLVKDPWRFHEFLAWQKEELMEIGLFLKQTKLMLWINIPFVGLTTYKNLAILKEIFLICDGKVVVELMEKSVFDFFGCEADFIKNLEWLKEQGIPVFLDDFGVGETGITFCSLVDVLDGVKIDKRYLFFSVGEKRKRTFFKNSILFLKNLGLKVCVEGIENEELFGLGMECGADFFQGFYLGKPREVQEMLKDTEKGGKK